MKPRSGHCVIIQSTMFWMFKRYRYHCETCGEEGRWFKGMQTPMAQGWYHDDVTLMRMLTEPRGT